MNTNQLFSPNWEELNLEDFSLNFGDIVSLKKENQLIKGIVLDFSADNAGKWYGICFLENTQLFGRKIPNGLFGNHIDLLDFVYINETAIHNLYFDKSRAVSIVPAIPDALSFAPGESDVPSIGSETLESISPDMMT